MRGTAGAGRERGRRRVGGEQEALGGEGDGGGDWLVAHDEGHVHGPVAAGGVAVLAGAVERVDDPEPPGPAPLTGGRVAGPGLLLGQHRVVGHPLRQRFEQQGVGTTVALGADALGGGAVGREAFPQVDEHAAGGVGQVRSEAVVVGGGDGRVRRGGGSGHG